MSSIPSDAPREFSAGAETQLRDAFAHYASRWRDEPEALVREALERLCREAHERELGPEQMLIAVKAAWAAVPEVNGLDYDRQRILFDQLFGYCLDAYYADAPALTRGS